MFNNNYLLKKIGTVNIFMRHMKNDIVLIYIHHLLHFI